MTDIPRDEIITAFCSPVFKPESLDKKDALNLVHFFRDIQRLNEPLEPYVIEQMQSIRESLDDRLLLLCEYVAPSESRSRARVMADITKKAVHAVLDDEDIVDLSLLDDDESEFDAPADSDVNVELPEPANIDMVVHGNDSDSDSSSIFGNDNWDEQAEPYEDAGDTDVYDMDTVGAASLLVMNEQLKVKGSPTLFTSQLQSNAIAALKYLEASHETISDEVRKVLTRSDLRDFIQQIVACSEANAQVESGEVSERVARYVHLAENMLRQN